MTSFSGLVIVAWCVSHPAVDPDEASLDPDRFSRPIEEIAVDPDRASLDPDRFSHDFEDRVNPVEWSGYSPYPPPPWGHPYFRYHRYRLDPRDRFHRFRRFHDYRPYPNGGYFPRSGLHPWSYRGDRWPRIRHPYGRPLPYG